MNDNEIDWPILGRRIYNIALRMLMHPDHAEDAAGDIMVKIVEGLPNFRGDSTVETWAHRIAVNHLLSIRSRHPSVRGITFEAFGADLNSIPAPDPDPGEAAVEAAELEELKIGCTNAMLQCLNGPSRMIFVLVELFGMATAEVADVTGMTPEAARKRLSRARGRMGSFLRSHCGLMRAGAPCQCRRRLPIARERGRVDPNRLVFQASADTMRLKDAMEHMDEAARVHRDTPYFELPPSLRERLEVSIAALSSGSGQSDQAQRP